MKAGCEGSDLFRRALDPVCMLSEKILITMSLSGEEQLSDG